MSTLTLTSISVQSCCAKSRIYILRTLPYTHLCVMRVKCVECEAGVSNIIPEKKVGFSVKCCQTKGEGEQIAAL